jgi:hypothetical protein
MAQRPAGAPRLLDQVRNVLRTKHYSIRTEQAYVDWIRRFILFHGKRHPRSLRESEVARFLAHVAVSRQMVAGADVRDAGNYGARQGCGVYPP